MEAVRNKLRIPWQNSVVKQKRIMMSGHPVPYYKSFKMNAIVGMFWREKHGLRVILTINQGKTIKTVINTEKSDITKLLSPEMIS